MSARHDRAELAAFQDGESCLVWARRRDSGERYYLVDGTARQLRTVAREHLECFMPDCGDRRLMTVARHPKRRDGFRHYPGAGGHAPESEAHQQGKALLARWAQDTLGPLGVGVAMEESTSDRARVADVMVTWPDGRQVALEVQYAALSVQQWRDRHESYRASGITDVWLLGHSGPHLRSVPRAPGGAEDGRPPVKLGDLHHAIAEAGVPLLWLNPVLESVGTVGVSSEVHAVEGVDYADGHDRTMFPVPPGSQPRAWFASDPLVGCTLTPEGLLTPSLGRLQAAAAELEAINASRRATDAARAAVVEARRAQARAREDARRQEELRARAEEDAAWHTSSLHGALLHLHGSVPAPLVVEVDAERLVGAAPAHWRTAVYRHLLWHRVGESFEFVDAIRAVRQEGLAAAPTAQLALFRSVSLWLWWLDDQGYVEVEPSAERRAGMGAVTVLGDLAAPPPVPVIPGPSDPLLRHYRYARYVATRRAAGSTRIGNIVPDLHCSGCGGRLDPALRVSGRHVLCR